MILLKASISPVLEHVIDRPRKKRTAEKVISILGVPSDAVVSFVRFLYSSRFKSLFLTDFDFGSAFGFDF